MIFSGCSQAPNVLDCSSNDLVVFASSKNLCLAPLPSKNTTQLNFDKGRIARTTAAHAKDITCVKFLKRLNGKLLSDSDKLITSCVDGFCTLWELTDVRSDPSLIKIGSRKFHEFSANYCCGVCITDNSCIVVTCGADSKICIYRAYVKQQLLKEVQPMNENCLQNDQTDPETLQIINTGTAIPLCADFALRHLLSNGAIGLLLAVGTSKYTIDIYTSVSTLDNIIPTFTPRQTLSGHTDWVRSLAFKNDMEYLVSAGQDCLLRLWKFSIVEKKEKNDEEDILRLDHKTIEFDSSSENYGLKLNVTADAVLAGHDDWIYSIEWDPSKGADRFLTASMDKSVIIWQPDPETGIWIESVRVGDVGGQAVGYFGAVFSSDASTVISHSYFGGLHFWQRVIEETGEWWRAAAFCVGGHFGAVTDIDWDPSGTFLLSCSRDQTARIFAPYAKADQPHLIEIARPQLHGHDLQCVAFVSSSCFVSGAEEKIFRVFRAPNTFALSLMELSKIDVNKIFADFDKLSDIGASVPSLGLSNKALSSEDSGSKMGTDDFHAEPIILKVPPTEDHLMQSTLWPEVQKLYGHGFEVFAVASNNAGTLIATSCKASKTENAKVLLWDTKVWQKRCEMEGHSLTVTQLAFSPDDSMLLSVSRDRNWILYRPLNAQNSYCWAKCAQSEQKPAVHTRIIWSCSWSPDAQFFATASRDRKIAIWSVVEKMTKLESQITREDSVTAIDFAKDLFENKYVLACGLEIGKIELFLWTRGNQLEMIRQLDQSEAHCATVRRLRFRPLAYTDFGRPSKGSKSVSGYMFDMASCSDDRSVKLFRLLPFLC